MAILSVQGFDNMVDMGDLAATPITYLRSVSGSITHLPSGGRWGGGALNIPDGARLSTSKETNHTGIMGHFKFPAGFPSTRIVGCYTTQYANAMWALRVNADGSISALGGNNLPQVGVIAPAGTIKGDRWYYIAVHPTGGSITLKVNRSVYTISGSFSGTSTSSMRLHIEGPLVIDDVVTTSSDHTSHDPQRIYTLTPSSNLPTQDFSFTGAASAWEAVNNIPPDDNTSYISSGTLADSSEFGVSDLDGDATSVLAVLLSTRAARDNTGGSANVKTSLKNANSSLISDVVCNLNDDVWFNYLSSVMETNPDTASPFTPTEINGVYVANEVI